jgi:hypothetical protein
LRNDIDQPNFRDKHGNEQTDSESYREMKVTLKMGLRDILEHDVRGLATVHHLTMSSQFTAYDILYLLILGKASL